MVFSRKKNGGYRTALTLFFIIFTPAYGFTATKGLHHSVLQALKTNPQIKAISYEVEALEHNLKQARRGFMPTLDVTLGYGPEQYSTRARRQEGADPSDSDWYERKDATLTLTQPLFAGGKIINQVRIGKSQFESGRFGLQAAIHSIILEAITAHLNLVQERELVLLAKNNIDIHSDIYQSLAERAKAGAGSIADASKAKTRMAQAQSSLYLIQANLSKAEANYIQVIGESAAPKLAPAIVPQNLPDSLLETFDLIKKKNPELLAMNASVKEANSRLGLARSNYLPKIDLELSSSYYDGKEGDPSWQQTNAAMVQLSWNLFNGGQDKSGVNAAASRKQQSRALRTVKLKQLKATAATVWEYYLSMQRQKSAYQQATDSSRKTFNAYLNQFNISKRSLLEVLSAVNDYFQSTFQLVKVSTNEVLAAYRILELTGGLRTPASVNIEKSLDKS
ncbi:MAG: TolC family outer membrane protein [Desulfobacteraceae bacterium]|nr:TolC family outer membrane protein [Desulfobacteraceae bacterium]